MTDIVSDDTLSKALKYLAETDEPCGKAKALMEGLQDQTKTIIGMTFLQFPLDMTAKEREQRANASQPVMDHLEKIQNAAADYEIMRNKRSTAVIITDVWRTAQANKRAGNI